MRVHLKGERRKSNFHNGADFFMIVREDIHGKEVFCYENVYHMQYPLKQAGELEDVVEPHDIPNIAWKWRDKFGTIHPYQVNQTTLAKKFFKQRDVRTE